MYSESSYFQSTITRYFPEAKFSSGIKRSFSMISIGILRSNRGATRANSNYDASHSYNFVTNLVNS